MHSRRTFLTTASLVVAGTAASQSFAQSGPKFPSYLVRGAPPNRLVTMQERAGSGAVAQQNSNVRVHYRGWVWSTRLEFDSSWTRGQPFEVQLGRNQLIAAWEQGIPGMKVGERRVLIVPPLLGYGSRLMQRIPANSTLIFTVDLLAVM